jgi:hypothetical protein
MQRDTPLTSLPLPHLQYIIAPFPIPSVRSRPSIEQLKPAGQGVCASVGWMVLWGGIAILACCSGGGGAVRRCRFGTDSVAEYV